MTREERIVEINKLRASGYNCCQTVATYFCEQLGMDKDQAYRMAEGFGIGMGDMEGPCGAVVGAVMTAGLKNSRGCEGEGKPTIPGTMKLGQQIIQAFKEKNQTIICNELKGVKTGKVIRDCPNCIADAIEIAEEVLGL